MQDKGFTPAGLVAIGNSIVTRAGPSLAVTKVEKKNAAQTVYNFSVADFHTYFVGQSQVWVHNTCGQGIHVPEGVPIPPGVSRDHYGDLGWDPDRGRWDRNEANTGLRIEQEWGADLRRVEPTDSRHGDWIGVDGKTSFDGCSPPRSSFFTQEMDNGNYMDSLRRHVDNPTIDFVVVDTTNLNLTSVQLQRLQNEIGALSGAQKSKIVFFPK